MLNIPEFWRSLYFKLICRFPFLWKWCLNFQRALAHSRNKNPSVFSEVLHSNGISIGSFDQFFSESAQSAYQEIQSFVENRIKERDVQDLLQGKSSQSEAKDYVSHLTNHRFSMNGPFVRLATDPQLLNIVNEYLGMKSYLRSMDLWLNFPTPGNAKETQLWHRDYDDYLNVKVFIYLNDVTEVNGPFCFIPGTHRVGSRATASLSRLARIDDATMKTEIPERDWKVCTGKTGTVILADTGGFHKGLKPQKNHRLLLMLQYTSGTPCFPRGFELIELNTARLNLDQRFALVR